MSQINIWPLRKTWHSTLWQNSCWQLQRSDVSCSWPPGYFIIVQVGSSSSSESSLKGLFEEILQEHDEEHGAGTTSTHVQLQTYSMWWSKLSHAQTAHSSTGQSTKFGFPLWLPLLQSFSAPLVAVWTARDCSTKHLTLWMQTKFEFLHLKFFSLKKNK